jgi:glutathione S-transferase
MSDQTPLLYFMPGTCAMAEIVALDWIGEPYRLCRVQREDRQTPAFLAMNPGGAVPVYREGDLTITQNAAILSHLEDRYPDRELAPAKGTAERAAYYQWLSYFGADYHPAHYPIFKTDRFHSDEAIQEQIREHAHKGVATHLARLNAYIAGRDTFLPSGRSLLDGYFAAVVRWSRRFHDYEQDFPEVHRLLTVLDEWEPVRRAKQIEAGELTEGGGLQGVEAF